MIICIFFLIRSTRRTSRKKSKNALFLQMLYNKFREFSVQHQKLYVTICHILSLMILLRIMSFTPMCVSLCIKNMRLRKTETEWIEDGDESGGRAIKRNIDSRIQWYWCVGLILYDTFCEWLCVLYHLEQRVARKAFTFCFSSFAEASVRVYGIVKAMGNR